ncbi:hypothetical protein M0811_12101 [Anaeramoeba ignava]|uniref:Uncharacterized protein n=1 Tax=Anaeramoeba ignava TaxID=1746090 RepID=A0A9Q0LAR0_ANAIG|nr:hypothetical protein M0811_12101 [Anaeramoeba ignava]
MEKQKYLEFIDYYNDVVMSLFQNSGCERDAHDRIFNLLKADIDPSKEIGDELIKSLLNPPNYEIAIDSYNLLMKILKNKKLNDFVLEKTLINPFNILNIINKIIENIKDETLIHGLILFLKLLFQFIKTKEIKLPTKLKTQMIPKLFKLKRVLKKKKKGFSSEILEFIAIITNLSTHSSNIYEIIKNFDNLDDEMMFIFQKLENESKFNFSICFLAHRSNIYKTKYPRITDVSKDLPKFICQIHFKLSESNLFHFYILLWFIVFCLKSNKLENSPKLKKRLIKIEKESSKTVSNSLFQSFFIEKNLELNSLIKDF